MRQIKEKNLLLVLYKTDETEQTTLYKIGSFRNLEDVVYNNELYSFAKCYRFNGASMELAEDELYKEDFKELYYMDDERDGIEDIKCYCEDDGQIHYFCKANWDNHDSYLIYNRDSSIEFDEFKIGDVYEAELMDERGYRYYMFVNGVRTIYLRRESGEKYLVEITKEEFTEFERVNK